MEVYGGYRLHRVIATGLSSQVWEVVELASHRHFAMKLLLPEKIGDAESRHMLIHEAEVGVKLAHPNIIKIITLDKNPKNPFFVMEFFPSGSLKARILHRDDQWIKENAQDVLKQAATGLAYMNASGWVHRDVKPDNFLVSAAGDVRVIDFAISQKVSTGMGGFFRKRGPVQGTHSYMSPEQIKNEGLDGRADVYSFGATAYELICGRAPFRGATKDDLLSKHLTEKPLSPQVYNKDITDDFANLVLKMIAKKKEDRPGNFHEVLMAMRKTRIFRSYIPPRKPPQGA